ncbi:hypothetical protein BOTNAR_0465g00060 [Botryotinia narcissicola]|uniref:Uncharacterized protein n=1 Tax=Botryotinia narcissicola TaxID=278944 RepID=A0A4Z1HHZ6_9HELO|nr:hypothetical protein BOTNAR_0465g00060 [Botryotinia narcissicola]
MTVPNAKLEIDRQSSTADTWQRMRVCTAEYITSVEIYYLFAVVAGAFTVEFITSLLSADVDGLVTLSHLPV